MSTNGEQSFAPRESRTFHVVDYVLFSVTLAVSAGIGLFLAYRDKHKKSTHEYLLAGQSMPIVPVSLSLLSSFVSAITILGTPSEIYTFGTMYVWFGVTYLTSLVFAAHLYIPIFYQLGVTSAYEYLEKRFNKLIRTVSSIAYCAQTVLLMAIVLYAPSLALNAVTNLSLWGTVCAVGVVCTLYTMLGGMKAVLWTDTFQVGVMYLGLIVILIKGSIDLGGFARAWDIAAERGRTEFLDFSGDPTIRHSFWALVVGGTFTSLSIYGTNQSQVQRSLTLPTLRKSKIAIWLNLPLKFILVNLCVLVGILMFAFYANCDPLKLEVVKARDQVLPLFVMDLLGSIPGIPGLFVAVLFSGALSTLSSGLNSMSAVIIQDIVKPFIKKDIKDNTALILAKVLAVALGAICLGLSYVASLLGGVLQAAITLDGVIGGSLLGVFTLGMVFPWANSYGAFAGLITSVSFLLWVSVGAKVEKPPIRRGQLPRSIAGCDLNTTLLQNINTSTIATTTTEILAPQNTTVIVERASSPLDSLYSISYLYYGLMAVIIVCLVGMIVSLLTGPTKPSTLDPKLMCPFFDIYFPWLPEKIRRPLRFGVRYHELVDKESTGMNSSKDLKEKETRDYSEETHL